jgi:VIT1/CCC1 family predicted Fe2+/Mn2+ transporter
MDKMLMKNMIYYQRVEKTEYFIFKNLARCLKNTNDRAMLLTIADEELHHYAIWKTYTGRDVRPFIIRIFWARLLSIILGYTFVIKFMENQSHSFLNGKIFNDEFVAQYPLLKEMIADEEEHEQRLIGLLDEEKLRYAGSMVLGLNDALIEISGSLAGFTFAYQNTRLIAATGVIIGFAATLSMAASEFLSQRVDDNLSAFKSSLYTGVAYMITVFLLVLPYALLPKESYMAALVLMMLTGLFIILIFNYYIAVAKDLPFKRRFLEMASISIIVAVLSFGVGILVKTFLGVDI